MDELTAALAGSFQVTHRPNNPDAPHPRFAQYKVKNNVPDQQERRRRILEQQKKSRFDALSHVRRLGEDLWEEEEAAEEATEAGQGDEEEGMDAETSHATRPGRRYQNQLMLSEWLVEVPSDFEEEWLMKLCPIGKRCLVVASRGTTTAYAKNGYRLNNFPSLIAGGSRRRNHDNYSILDCIYSEVDRTYYILDLMCWAGHPIYDSETDFRFFWLQGKGGENPEIGQISKVNPFRFVVLPSFACDKVSIENAVASETDIKLDGLLFYHKRTHYLFGSTPLVLWLKAYMLPEILHASVPPRLLADRPASYTTLNNHVDQWRKEQEIIQEKKLKAKNQYAKEYKQSKERDTIPGEEEQMETGGKKGGSNRRRRRRGKGKGSEMEVGQEEEEEEEVIDMKDNQDKG